VPDCWCCAQKLHPVLIDICVYEVNRLYVENEKIVIRGIFTLNNNKHETSEEEIGGRGAIDFH
jgi:hypothetical protein